MLECQSVSEMIIDIDWIIPKQKSETHWERERKMANQWINRNSQQEIEVRSLSSQLPACLHFCWCSSSVCVYQSHNWRDARAFAISFFFLVFFYDILQSITRTKKMMHQNNGRKRHSLSLISLLLVVMKKQRRQPKQHTWEKRRRERERARTYRRKRKADCITMSVKLLYIGIVDEIFT